MSDVIQIIRLGTPAVALITEPFWRQSALVASSKDMSDVPRVQVAYPIAGTGAADIAAFARLTAPDVVRALRLR